MYSFCFRAKYIRLKDKSSAAPPLLERAVFLRFVSLGLGEPQKSNR